MSSDQIKALLDFIIHGSRTGLGDLCLAQWGRVRQAEAERKRKQEAEVEERAMAYFIDFVRDHGEEMAARIGGAASGNVRLPDVRKADDGSRVRGKADGPVRGGRKAGVQIAGSLRADLRAHRTARKRS